MSQDVSRRENREAFVSTIHKWSATN
jgi:hypothetical protein